MLKAGAIRFSFRGKGGENNLNPLNIGGGKCKQGGDLTKHKVDQENNLNIVQNRASTEPTFVRKLVPPE